MASEQGHWITKDGKKIFIKEDLIDKQYREIEKFQQMRNELNANNNPSTSYQADYTTEISKYPYSRQEVSKKAVNEVKEVIDKILKGAKKEKVGINDLEDYMWNRIHDALPTTSPYGDNIKVMGNNGGEYDPDTIIDCVEIYIHVPWRGGKVEVDLQGKSYYMSEFDDDDLEQMGIYKKI